jgi:hypothetical protein
MVRVRFALRPPHPLVLFLSGAVGSLACERGIELPEPPVEVEQLVAEYEEPSGTLNEQGAAALVTEALRRQQLVDASQLGLVVAEQLVAIRGQLEGRDLPTTPGQTAPDLPELDAFVRLRRICRGWEDDGAPPDQGLNGFIELTAVVEQGRLTPVLWGPAERCRTRVPLPGERELTWNAYLDGDLWVRPIGSLPRDVTEADFLLGFQGTVGGERLRGTVNFDLRFAYPQIELRLPVADGNVIASVGLEGVSLRARNGQFACSVEPPACGRL